jgi:MerR family transcriptional regulator, copper efflux regulator
VDGLQVTEAAERAGWSPRMLRYLERFGLVVPRRTAAGYRLYGLRELNQLRGLAELRRSFDLQISDLVFAARLRREPELRRAVDGWFAGADDLAWAAAGGPVLAPGNGGLAAVASSEWVEWEQRKHERLLEAA